MRILVTGYAGFIGFHLAKELLKNGNTVIGIDNFNDYYDVNLKIERNKYFFGSDLESRYFFFSSIVSNSKNKQCKQSD